MGWGAFAGAVAGALISNKGSSDKNKAQKEAAVGTSAFNAAEAKKNRDFQERMSSTAHQRQVEDLRKAGINPILSAKYGGSSTPTGSAAQGVMPQIVDEWTPAVNSAMSVMQTSSNVDLQQSQTEVNEVQVDKVIQEIKNLQVSENLSYMQLEQIAATTVKLREEVKKVAAETKGVEYQNVEKRILADFYNSAEPARIAKSIGVDASLLKSIIGKLFGK